MSKETIRHEGFDMKDYMKRRTSMNCKSRAVYGREAYYNDLTGMGHSKHLHEYRKKMKRAMRRSMKQELRKLDW